MTKYDSLSRLAALQEGHIAAWQCRFLGVSRQWVHEQTCRRAWVTVHDGVYRLPGVRQSWRGNVWAALLSIAGTSARGSVEELALSVDPVLALHAEVARRALATAWSAAAVHGHGRLAPARPQLLLPQGNQSLLAEVHVTRTRMFPERPRVVAGLPCAPPERVLWDAAWIGRRGRGSERSLHDLAIYFDRTRVLAISELLGVIEEPVSFGLPRRVPSMLRRAGELLSPGFSHSATEAVARRIIGELVEQRNLIASTRPVPIEDRGRIIAEADVAVESLRWDIEIDGPHHDTLEMQQRDRHRDGKLDRIDWVTTRYPTTLLDRSHLAFSEMVDHDLDVMIARRRGTRAA